MTEAKDRNLILRFWFDSQCFDQLTREEEFVKLAGKYKVSACHKYGHLLLFNRT